MSVRCPHVPLGRAGASSTTAVPENANVSDAPTLAILRRAVRSYVGGGPDRF